MKQPRPIEGMAAEFPQGIDRLFCRISFESRSLRVPLALAGSSRETIAFHSKQRSQTASRNLQLLAASSPFASRALDTRDALATADSMLELAAEIFSVRGGTTVIDVTSFRREELLMLLGMLAHLAQDAEVPECKLTYVGAAGMAEGWLSRNTLECRSVIGFAGEMKLSRPTHLIIMLGFEVERAVSVIESYEPSRITIGIGGATASISTELHARNKSFLDTISAVYGKTGRFEYSLRDPVTTMAELDEILGGDPYSNFVLAPLNNKLSTIGAGLLALKRRDVQICYAAVAEYNEATYSTPRNDAYIFDLAALLAHGMRRLKAR